MKVRLLKPAKNLQNPQYDHRAPINKVSNWPLIDLPAGAEYEDSLANFLCWGNDPIAEPIDEECLEKFAEYQANREARKKAAEAMREEKEQRRVEKLRQSRQRERERLPD